MKVVKHKRKEAIQNALNKIKAHWGTTCRRCGIVFLELSLAFIALFVFGVLLLAWQLSKGPVDISFLAPHLEKALSYPDKGVYLKLGNTTLEWVEKSEPIQISVQDVKVLGPEKKPILVMSRLGFAISRSDLLRGRVVPGMVTLYQPALKILRKTDGSFAFDFAEQNEKQDTHCFDNFV